MCGTRNCNLFIFKNLLCFAEVGAVSNSIASTCDRITINLVSTFFFRNTSPTLDSYANVATKRLGMLSQLPRTWASPRCALWNVIDARCRRNVITPPQQHVGLARV